MNKQIEIPSGYKARIEGNKVILEQNESEDERIRKRVIEQMELWHECALENNVVQDIKDSADAISYLEKQKEQNPAPTWMLKFLDELRTKSLPGWEDYDLHKEMEGKILAIIRWLSPDYFTKKEKEQKPISQEDFDTAKYEVLWEEQKPTEYEKPLLSKFEQAVYDCAWGKVTCKPEGETQEEYAKRWGEHFLLMVRDWADDYIDSQIELDIRKAYDKGKSDAEKIHRVEWSEEDETCLEYALWCVMKTRHFVAKDACDLDACQCAERWLNSLSERFELQPKQEMDLDDDFVFDEIMNIYDSNNCLPPRDKESLEMLIKVAHHFAEWGAIHLNTRK